MSEQDNFCGSGHPLQGSKSTFWEDCDACQSIFRGELAHFFTHESYEKVAVTPTSASAVVDYVANIFTEAGLQCDAGVAPEERRAVVETRRSHCRALGPWAEKLSKNSDTDLALVIAVYSEVLQRVKHGETTKVNDSLTAAEITEALSQNLSTSAQVAQIMKREGKLKGDAIDRIFDDFRDGRS